jgi:hypothetical protein
VSEESREDHHCGRKMPAMMENTEPQSEIRNPDRRTCWSWC